MPPIRERADADSPDQVAKTPQTDEILLQPRSAAARLPKKIGLLDHLGGGNLGDDATLDAVMQNIKSRWPDAEIFGFSMNPSDTQIRHGIRSYPIRAHTWSLGNRTEASNLTVKTKVKAALGNHRFLMGLLKAINAVVVRPPRTLLNELRFLAKSYRTIRSFDLLVISGGGQLLDSWGGPWKFPYTLFKWVLLARLSGVKCYFLNVGAGPLSHPISKWFVKRALLFADYVSFRDDDSKALIQETGFTGESHVLVDCVYSLDLSAASTRSVVKCEDAIVGLSPMAYYDPRIYWQKDQAVYENFIRNLASFGSWLSQNHYRLALFSTDTCFDAQTIEDVKTALKTRENNVEPEQIRHQPITRIDQLLAQMSSMDYIVTCRFHGVVFAHLLNKPVLALSHHSKVNTLMNDLGLAKYCLDIRTCDQASLRETFSSLVSNREEIKSCMAEKLTVYKGNLSLQFDDLFPQVVTI